MMTGLTGGVPEINFSVGHEFEHWPSAVAPVKINSYPVRNGKMSRGLMPHRKVKASFRIPTSIVKCRIRKLGQTIQVCSDKIRVEAEYVK
jgi:hypothetical protein